MNLQTLHLRALLLPVTVSLGLVAACYGGAAESAAGDGTAKSDATAGASTDGSTPQKGDGATLSSGKGIPCDVQAVLVEKCASCHGATPRAGAPMSLVTYDDLVREIPGEPGVTYIADSIELMQDAYNPMPPSGLLPAAQVEPLKAWLAAGLPPGTCGVPARDADGGIVTPPDPYATPMTCTSGTYYTRGKSMTMEPGNACNSCHSAKGEGPSFSIAGTVYKTAHEKNRCNGGAPGTTVVVTGADGKVQTLSLNSVGTFVSYAAVKLPYTAKVVSGSKVREMVGPQTSGDCNSCHTPEGTQGAPGRIMAP